MKSLAIELLKDLDAIDNINYRPHPGQQPLGVVAQTGKMSHVMKAFLSTPQPLSLE